MYSRFHSTRWLPPGWLRKPFRTHQAEKLKGRHVEERLYLLHHHSLPPSCLRCDSVVTPISIGRNADVQRISATLDRRLIGKNGEGWERRVKDWLYPYPQCSCVCDKNRRGDCWMTAVSDLPGWRFWGCPNTALVLCSALWNVYSAMRNVYSPLRNVHSALRNINRMPVLTKLEQDEWILLNSYAACICIPVGVGRGPVVNSYITCICYFPFCSGKGSCGELNRAQVKNLKSLELTKWSDFARNSVERVTY